jgi:signal transduction histidine kinase
MASHEFRTPLTTVLSSASLLSKYVSAEDQHKREKHIARIKNSVNNLNDILEDFLSLGKLNEGKVEIRSGDIMLDDLVNEVLEEMKGITRKGQQFQVEIPGELRFRSDRILLRNVLVNLVGNAIKFSEENKTITISGGKEGNFVKIRVKDEGIGISEADQRHLFTSFFRGANATNIQGTGLGLHIVKRHVDLLGGRVELFSQLNKGTSITFHIPAN